VKPPANPPIVCVSDLFWDEHWSSEQQLMSRLAADRQVLYVERPVSLLSFFTGCSDGSIGRQFWRWLRGGLRKERENLAILTPPPFLPLRYNRVVNKLNQWIRVLSIRRAMKRLNFEDPILWIYEPDAGGMVGALGEVFSLYYCADDWGASEQWWNNVDEIRARETELASKVDLVVGTATRIVERWKTTVKNTLLVSNGADVTSFMAARDGALQVPEDLMRIPAPRIGYVGFVNGRFDTRLYERLAELRPEWHWVIIGPLMERYVDLSRLKGMTNVHFLGARSRESLPAYLSGLDVCTIPYICNKMAESIFPLKLFEYLGAGRQVVSTALPELAAFTEHLRIARTPEEFAMAIEMSLSAPLPRVSDEFLDANSWDSKAAFLWQWVSRSVREARAAVAG
jgi:hypothetical protein